MALVSISHDLYSHGEEVAERVAKQLGVECFSREVIFEAAKKYNVTEEAIQKAVHDAPSFMDRLSASKARHLAMFRAALLRHVESGKGVYHGLAGHFFFLDVPHVLRVRVVACFEARIIERVRRDRVDEETARRELEREDNQRGAWTKKIYGKDYRSPEQYDMTLNLGLMRLDDSINLICHATGMPAYKSAPGQARRLRDLAIAAECEARLLGEFSGVKATSIEGKIRVEVRSPMGREREIADEVRSSCRAIDGVKTVCVGVNDEMEFTGR